MKKYKSIAFILAVCMVLTMTPAAAFADTGAKADSQAVPAEPAGQAFADMTGHWAAQAVGKWAGLGIVKGDNKGFRPNDSITRAELAVILDNLMDYQAKSNSKFNDVKSGAWYEDAVLKANAAGILNGDGEGHALPNAKVTREQAAAMLARAFGVDENKGEKTGFKDSAFISGWARGLVFGMEESGYIGGMGNGNFNPKSDITRAQVVTMIDNAVAAYYTKEGVYTENVAPKAEGANCVAIVKVSGVILKNGVVSGDLIIAEGVGKGDFTLDGTTVSGKLIARGGGENSIHVINGAEVKGKVTVEKVNGAVRIVSDGVVLANLEADAEVILEGEFTNVTVAEGASVEIKGKVGRLEVTGKAEIKAVKDSKIESITIGDGAKGTNLNMDKNAEVNKLEAKADVITSGEGAPKSVTGTGSVTTKDGSAVNKDKGSGGSGGGGGGGNGGDGDADNTADKRALIIEEYYRNAAIVKQNSDGLSVKFDGKDKSGEACTGLMLGDLTVSNGVTLLNASDYYISAKSDSLFFEADYLNELSEGKHTFTYSVKTSDGKTFSTSGNIYVVPDSAVILYDQPGSGTLEVTNKGAAVVSGSSVKLTGYNSIGLKLTGLPKGKRIKSAIVTNSYYGYTETKDITYDLVMEGVTSIRPRGTTTIRVVTEEIPSELPVISAVEFYLGYDYNTKTFLDRVATEVPAMVPDDGSSLYAKVLFKNGETCQFANYKWVQKCETESITLEEGTENRGPLYWEFEDADSVMELTVTGYENQSTGSAIASIIIRKPLKHQSSPTNLSGTAASSAAAKDGKIIGTTPEMEYKLSTAPESAYATCTAGETTGLGVGTYYVRMKAKPGYAASYETEVDIYLNQAAPAGLTGIASTGPYNYDAKISGTTTAMEWRRSGETYYYTCSEGSTEVDFAGTYYVRYKAKTGYYAGAEAEVAVPAYVNKDQTAPTGLTPVSPTRATGNNGKITGTSKDMEYRISSETTYKDCSADETGWLAAGTYYVRLKASAGYNAGADAEVVIIAPPAKNIATLQRLGYVLTYNGSPEYTLVDNFDPAKTEYDVPLYGNNYGKTFNLNPYASDPGFATVSYSAVTVHEGEYTAVLKAEVTAEDGVTKKTYTVNITVERRTGTSSISPTVYSISSDAVPVIKLSLTDRDGDSCSLQSLISSDDDIVITDQFQNVIEPEYYTVDAANSKITVKKEYFSGKLPGTTPYYFNVTITTADEDKYILEVNRVNAPYVTITN